SRLKSWSGSGSIWLACGLPSEGPVCQLEIPFDHVRVVGLMVPLQLEVADSDGNTDLQHEQGFSAGSYIGAFQRGHTRVFQVRKPTFGPRPIGIEDALILETAWRRPGLKRRQLPLAERDGHFRLAALIPAGVPVRRRERFGVVVVKAVRLERTTHTTLLSRALQPALPPEVFCFSWRAGGSLDVAEPRAIQAPHDKREALGKHLVVPVQTRGIFVNLPDPVRRVTGEPIHRSWTVEVSPR